MYTNLLQRPAGGSVTVAPHRTAAVTTLSREGARQHTQVNMFTIINQRQ
jgi:hypothetical protein